MIVRTFTRDSMTLHLYIVINVDCCIRVFDKYKYSIYVC